MFEAEYFFYLLLFLIGIVLTVYIIRAVFLFKKTLVLEKNSAAFQQKPGNSKKMILVVGDSTAMGTGSETSRESTAGRMGALFPDAAIINEGINGQKIEELVDSFNNSDLSKVDLLVIQIGANDIVQFTPVNNVERDLNILLEKASKISKRIVVLHGGNVGNAPFFPRWLSFLWNNRTKAIRDLYMNDVPKRGGVYVDLYKNRAEDIFLTDPKKYYAADRFHPSGEGYKIWFDKIVLTLREKYGNNFLG